MTISIENLATFLDELSLTHGGMTLDSSNVTMDGLAYFINYGMKQSLSDTGAGKAAIVGVTDSGDVPSVVWKEDKRVKEAKRLGIPYNGTSADREALAKAWVADANGAKFAKILDGELTVSENGARGNPLEKEIRAIVETAVLAKIRKDNDSLPKASRKAIPAGKDLRKLVDATIDGLSDEAREKVTAKAQARLDALSGDIDLD